MPDSFKYLSMTEAEVTLAIEEIIAGIATIDDFDEVYERFLALLAYRNINTKKIAAAALAHKKFTPPELYRDASPAMRDELIEMLLDFDCNVASDLLQCLAVQGDDVVLKTFFRLEQNQLLLQQKLALPRDEQDMQAIVQLSKNLLPWQQNMWASPSLYAEHAGGWTFDHEARRTNLTFPECYAMLPAVERSDTAVSTGCPRHDVCPHCGSQLQDVLVLDGKDARLAFLGLEGKVRIPLCLSCARDSCKTLVRYLPDGESTLEIIGADADGTQEQQSHNGATSKTLTLSKQPVSPFYAFGNDIAITIGGMANWIQDAHYETCPGCGKKMRYFAGIPWEVLTERKGTGTLYAEICTDCHVISLFHQQT